MGEELEVIGRDEGERLVQVVGVEKIDELGTMWQEDIAKLKACGASIDETNPGELRGYLECMKLMGQIAKDLLVLKKGIGADGEDLLKSLGLSL
jgi:hypothetical protein